MLQPGIISCPIYLSTHMKRVVRPSVRLKLCLCVCDFHEVGPPTASHITSKLGQLLCWPSQAGHAKRMDSLKCVDET